MGAEQAHAVRVRRKNGTRQTEAADAPPAPPPPLHTPFDEVPPDESDPRKRAHPTLGVVELTDEGRAHVAAAAAVGPPPPLDIPGAGYEIPDVADKNVFRTLEDIMGAFPIGDDSGQYFVHVMRTHPAVYFGTSTKGILRKVRRRMTLEEFRNEYGGGVYDLIVYGPPKRGGLPDEITGTVRPKALTKPIRITIPYHQNGGHPPNLDVAYEEEEEDEAVDMMRDAHLPFGIPARQATPAAAQIVNHELRHREVMDDRERIERKERRRERESRDTSALEIMARQHEEQRRQDADLIRELRDEIKAIGRQRPNSDLEGMAKVLSTVNPRTSQDELQALRDGHQREVDRLTQQHRQELDAINRRFSEDRTRLDEQRRGELERAEARITDAARRADDRVRDVEQRLERAQEQTRSELARQKQELDAAHDRELVFAKSEFARNLEAQKSNYDNLIASERRSSEREILVNKEIASSQLATEKRTLEVELRGVKAELTRRDRELEELKKLAERSKDLSKLLEDARKQAELLGWSPKEEGGGGEDDADWKTTIMRVLPKIPELLPQILQSAGGAIAAARGNQPRPAQAQQQLPPMMPNPGMRAMAPPRRVFATEGSGLEPTGGPQFFEPTNFTPPPELAQPQAAPQQPMEFMAPQTVGFPPPAPQPQIAPAIAQPPVARPSAPPPGPGSVAPAAPTPMVDTALDAMILQGCQELLEPAHASGDPVEKVAAFVVGRFGKDQVTQVLPTFNPDNVLGALRRSGKSSRLQSRAGKRYLTELQAAILQELKKT